MSDFNQNISENDIAVIGISGRFPGARNCGEFWYNLEHGIEPLSHFDPAEILASGIAPERVMDPDYVRKRFILDDIELWDPAFFGFTPNEALMMDPQQRLFLECVYEALENAGHNPDVDSARIGVFAGSSSSSYRRLWKSNPAFAQMADSFNAALVNDREHLVTRVAYKLGLRGPAIAVNTACSTGLIAIALACQGLNTGDCDIALAGACSVHLPQMDGLMYQEGGINSPDGHCRPFDARAAGTVAGNGLGVVVLRRLREAIDDGDSIYAVIKGYAMNNDGNAKVGFTAPSVEGQSEVIAMAQALAGVGPDEIDFIEAHGTATHLGDAIEVSALNRVFKSATNRKQFCAIGSVKSNIGHLDAAAGVAGFLKAVLALHHRKIPPTVNFETPNPKIQIEDGPFFVNSTILPWKERGRPRRAGVSSFGVGGSNAHVVLEEAPASVKPDPSRSSQLLLLSAKTEQALDDAGKQWSEYLRLNPDMSFADITYTSHVGRKAYQHRQAIVCSDGGEAVAALAGPSRYFSKRTHVVPGHRPVVFLCTGQGSQYVNMGRKLYQTEQVFREEFERISACALPDVKQRVLAALFPAEGQVQMAAEQLRQTEIAQPALFCLEYAIAQTWIRWGVRPEAFIGHSLGEYVAACLSGVFTPEEGLRLVSTRGRLMQTLPPGAMLAVNLSTSEAADFAAGVVSIAASNTRSWTVLSGPVDALQQIEIEMQQNEIEHRRLQTSHAFHSPGMDPILDNFRREIARIKLSPPQQTYISNLTGNWITAQEATSPEYWVRHLREPVRFMEGALTLLQDADRIYLEIGPGSTLANFIRSCSDKQVQVVSSLPGPGEKTDEVEHVTSSIAGLWLAGIELDWKSYHLHERRTRLPLPTYPFQKQSYWIPAAPPGKSRFQANDQGGNAVTSIAHSQPEIVAKEAVHNSSDGGHDWIQEELRRIVAKTLGIPAEKLNGTDDLVKLGLDSLILIDISNSIRKTFKVKVPFRSLVQEFSVIEALAGHLAQSMPEKPAPVIQAHNKSTAGQPKEPTMFPVQTVTGQGGIPAGDQAQIFQNIQDQLASLAEQIKTLTQINGGKVASRVEPATLAGTTNDEPTQDRPATQVALKTPPNQHYVPFQPVRPDASALTERQQRHIHQLIDRYCARTASSKKFTQEHRKHLADNRALLGFRLAWKELVYPIIASSSRGSRIWDLDGNEYVDLTMGFGVHLLGHSPECVTEAVQRQLTQGVALGPQSETAGEVARYISEFTGNERVAFCNSGTEAVMSSIRLARAATGREKIATFAGAYHGTADATLGRLGGNALKDGTPVPVAPGVAVSAMGDLLIVPYGTDESLEILQKHSEQLAAVLVEPIQSRRPDIQPREFLQQLREITQRAGIALIFDDMITGFRIAQGGSQQWFGVKADMATYGKVVGGGMPLGVVAGSSQFMDGIDGGWWQYGDSSYPQEDQTIFAGTFCKHPLTMAASLAMLKYLKASGPSLQLELNRRSDSFVSELNTTCVKNNVPLKALSCGSMIRFLPLDNSEFLDLFFYHLAEKGVFLWEGRTSFISTAHTDRDLEFVLQVFEECAKEMHGGGFFQHVADKVTHRVEVADSGRGKVSGVPAAAEPVGSEGLVLAERVLPATEQQTQLWALAQLGEESSCAYNESMCLTTFGPLDEACLRRALSRVVQRHDSLRTVFSSDGRHQRVLSALEIDIQLVDLSQEKEGERKKKQILQAEARSPFDLAHGPLLRLKLIKLANESYCLAITGHHLVFDGASVSTFLDELSAFYVSEQNRTSVRLAMPKQFGDYVKWQAVTDQFADVETSKRYWMDQFRDSVPALQLPSNPRPPLYTYAGEEQRMRLSPGTCERLKALGRQHGLTFFTLLLSGYGALLARHSGQNALTIGIHSAGQTFISGPPIIGHCVNLLPLHLKCRMEQSFLENAALHKNAVLDAFEHQLYPYSRLAADLKIQRDPSRLTLVETVFNLDQGSSRAKLFGMEVEIDTIPTGYTKWDLSWNVTDDLRDGNLKCEYNSDLFTTGMIRKLMQEYEAILITATSAPDLRLADVLQMAENLAQTKQMEAEQQRRAATADRLKHARRKTVVAQSASTH
jgi:acyl transferase domain-containing protein